MSTVDTIPFDARSPTVVSERQLEPSQLLPRPGTPTQPYLAHRQDPDLTTPAAGQERRRRHEAKAAPITPKSVYFARVSGWTNKYTK